MNATQFGNKYGKKYLRKISTWHDKHYLGKSSRDTKTGEYSIPDDVPLPYSTRGNVSQLPTLWKEILDAASNTNSLFETMYPKLPSGVFRRQIDDFTKAGFIRISKTISGDSYLEILPAGYEFLNNLNEKEKKNILGKVSKAVNAGIPLVQAFIAAWPYIQPFIQQ